MITMIGTGHVFKVSEQVSFIVKHSWPDAVLVEIDERMYKAMTGGPEETGLPKDPPKLYRKEAEYQTRTSKKNETVSGGDLIAAVEAGKAAGADIICIDMDVQQLMREVEEDMPFFESIRYSLTSATDGLFGRRKAGANRRKFVADEETYIRNMRRKFPTLVEKLVDERDAYMAERIKEAAGIYRNVVVVVGDAHVRAICDILGDPEIEQIRLAEMLDRESMDRIRGRIWNRKAEAKE